MPETLISPPEGPGLAATDSKENISGSVDTKASTSARKKSTTRINMKAVAQICMFAVRLSLCPSVTF